MDIRLPPECVASMRTPSTGRRHATLPFQAGPLHVDPDPTEDAGAQSVMSSRALPHFLLARALSIFGDRVTDLVLPLAVLATSGSATTAGTVGAALQLPQILGALQVGVLVDRRERKHLMVLADLARAAVFLGIGMELVLGGARLVPLVLLALVAGAGDAVFHTAASSYLPSLVTDRELVRTNGLVEGTDAAATLTGPAVGGWLLQSLGPLAALLTNAASFVASAALLARLPVGIPTPEGPDGDRSVLAGLRLVRANRAQTVLLACACYQHLLAAVTFLPLLVRAERELHLTPLATGLIVSAAGLGGLLSSFVLARFCDTPRWPVLLAAVMSVNGGAVAALALFDRPLWLAATVLVVDGSSALGFVVVASIRQRITPDALRGKVFSAGTAVTATVRMLALVSVGTLIDRAGPGPVLLALAALALPFVVFLCSFKRDA
ncbi:MFS transporter [Nocardia sp. NPDC048505]|uniref:MFS transporter n=1 Tax=unclassified Nocardia TaxID=2637762 RepID=UPI0033DBFF18